MATRYAAIPAVPQGNLTGASTVVLVTALKENVELLTGTRGEEDLASKAIAIDQIQIASLPYKLCNKYLLKVKDLLQ